MDGACQQLDMNRDGERTVVWDVRLHTVGLIQGRATPEWSNAVVEVKRSQDGRTWKSMAASVTLSAPGYTSTLNLVGVNYLCVEVMTAEGSICSGSFGLGSNDARVIACDTESVADAGAVMKTHTRSAGITVGDPVDTDVWAFFHTPAAITVSRIYGITDAGTVTFKVEWRPEGTPDSSGTEVHATGLAADTNGEEQTSGFNDATIPAASFLTYVASATTGSPTKLRVVVEYTYD